MGLPLWARLVVGIGVAGLLAYVTTPLAIVTARRFAFYDAPRGYKAHAAPTPYLGGVAVMVAFALAVLVGAGHLGRTLPLLGGVSVLVVAGTIDDRRTLSPQLRVAIEFGLGVLLAFVHLGWRLGAGPAVDALLTGVWVVAVVNAFNLFDNMDGAASAMGFVVAGGACVLAVVTGDVWVAAGSAALCGACLGFIPHNLSSPARIFLGDGGSMPLGFAVAALVANAARSAESSSLALLVGFLLVGIPALDTCLVIVSRRRRGVSVLTGGQDHLTHRTRARIQTARRVAVVLGAAQALVSALVIVASRGSSTALVYVALAFVVCAAAVIVALEDAIPLAEQENGVLTGAGAPPSRAGLATLLPFAGLAVIGLGAGLSPLFAGYYSLGVWVTIGLVLVISATAAIIARPLDFNLPLALTVTGLAVLGLWSLLSSSWAATAEQATVEANRWLTYMALLLVGVVLIRGRRHAGTLLAAAGLGIALVAATVFVRLLGSHPGALFLGARLNAPLGYINGEGCVFAMGCWFSLALAERRQPLLAGLGAAGTVALAGLTLLSESRGAAIALGVAILVALLAIPGARRRLLALAAIGAGFASCAATVVHVYSSGQSTGVSGHAAHMAAGAILLAAAATGVVWGLIVAGELVIERSGRTASATLRRAGSLAAVLVVLVPAAVALARATSIEHTLRSQWHAFVHLSDQATSTAQTRLFSGAGNRYDYWRVAWHVFRGHPLAGVGAGNYSQSYFQQRHTTESIQNPHSLELQVLSELGIVGAIALAVAIAGVALAVRSLRRAAYSSRAARTMMVVSLGAGVTWLVDTSGDWMHLLPGVSAIAFAALAVLLSAGREENRAATARPPRRRLPMLLSAAAVAIVLAIAGASLMRSGLTQRFLDDAKAELAHNPAAAIDDANTALRLDSANLDAYYVKAAGLARFNRAQPARRTLLDAAAQDPSNFVTWTLLGDLEVRLHHFRKAQAYYTRAHRLDPNDPTLAELAKNPRSALSAP